MKFITNLSVIITASFLVSCANQNKITQEKITPVTNPCEKLELLMTAYDNNFDSIKQSPVNSRISNIWKAKYHLVGSSCQVWSRGEEVVTYSCDLMAPDQKTGQVYYENAKSITQQCLGNAWQMKEQARKNDAGLKAEFTNSNEELSISTHLVPSDGLFKSQWTVYYYVGKTKN